MYGSHLKSRGPTDCCTIAIWLTEPITKLVQLQRQSIGVIAVVRVV
jgi:hypothetical protein